MAEAKAKSTSVIELRLRLSKEESRLLMAMMQNPLSEHESDELEGIRHAIFHALQEANE